VGRAEGEEQFPETQGQVLHGGAGFSYCLMTLARDVDGEERWQTIGMAGWHAVEDGQDQDLTVCILSARKVTPVERRRYEAEAY
jgi:uncharacterized DUF497 family protein